jgi:hypothetical protein
MKREIISMSPFRKIMNIYMPLKHENTKIHKTMNACHIYLVKICDFVAKITLRNRLNFESVRFFCTVREV